MLPIAIRTGTAGTFRCQLITTPHQPYPFMAGRYTSSIIIILCGDRSTGKNFILEATSVLSFPTTDKLCTRFATELPIGSDGTPSLNISSTRWPDRTPEEGASLSTLTHPDGYR